MARPSFHHFLLALAAFSFATTLQHESDADNSDSISRALNDTLLWGPYRPNIYFGVKPRLPESFISGLMWSGVSGNLKFIDAFRHTCEQGNDMVGYGWEEYDVRTGGKQVMYDKGNMIDISTEFVKVSSGNHGGHWGVRIKGTLRADAPPDKKTAVWFYSGVEGLGKMELVNEPDEMGLVGNVNLKGSIPRLGEFKLQITTGPKTNKNPTSGHTRPLDRTHYVSVEKPSKDVWRAKDHLFEKLEEAYVKLKQQYPNGMQDIQPWQAFVIRDRFGPGNLHYVQKVFEGSFEFDVLYSSSSAPTSMTSDLLTSKIKQNSEAFSKRFNKIFKRQAPYNTQKYLKFSHTMFSNLLGGIGYFYGTSKVDRSNAEAYTEEEEGFWGDAKAAQDAHIQAADNGLINTDEGPSELFTSIPSRPFFPRGFYWDEGFHLLPISQWDMDLTLKIVKSWFALMDEDGWIGREQILGEEARSKVPKEFQMQYPHYANPPTLFVILTKYIDMYEMAQAASKSSKGDFNSGSHIEPEDMATMPLRVPKVALKFFHEIYPKLHSHYYWFRKSQSGEVRDWDRQAFSTKEAYRWRGRTPSLCLTSGFDDYPRALPPHTGELHVDLLSWMGLMTKCIRRIATTIGEDEDATEFARIEEAMARNVDDLHWSEEHQMYCDATIDDFYESVHVCHKGYVSILPVLLGLVDSNNGKTAKVLSLMEDPEELWSEYGLRSLSKSDSNFGTGENYWKGPVWININYLAITRLYEIGSASGPNRKQAAQIYKKLRKAVVDNVYRNWEETGYAWEQYDSITGKGQRTAHFLGWTSLVINIMGLPEEVIIKPVEKAEGVVRDEL